MNLFSVLACPVGEDDKLQNISRLETSWKSYNTPSNDISAKETKHQHFFAFQLNKKTCFVLFKCLFCISCKRSKTKLLSKEEYQRDFFYLSI